MNDLQLDYLRPFMSHLVSNVHVVRTIARDQKSAFRIFETLNFRALPLEPEDLLKNLLLQHIPEGEYDSFAAKWDNFVGKLTTTTGRYVVQISTFLRHYIMSHGYYKNKEDIYPWFKDFAENRAGGINRDEVNRLLDELYESATKYRSYFEGKGSPSVAALRKLLFRQGYIILLASFRLPSKHFQQICEAVEKVAFAYVITGSKTNELEHEFCRIAAIARQAIDDQPKIQEVIERLQIKAGELQESVRAKLMQLGYRTRADERKIRYILEKLAHSLDGHDYSSQEYTIEHVLPEDKTKVRPNAPDEEYRDLISRLGNLTLITHSDNSSAQNDPPEKKWLIYENQTIRLTSSLAKSITTGTGKTKFDKAISAFNYTPPPYATWDEEQIDRRTQAMTNLAMHVWFSA